MPSLRASVTLSLIVPVLLSCGKPREVDPGPRSVLVPGVAAVKVAPAANGQWLLVSETLQAQELVTTPLRSAGLLGARSDVFATLDAPEGWILIDAAAHPSGSVTLLSLRADYAEAYPLRVLLTRVGADGARVDQELERAAPPGGIEAPPTFMASLDRARLVAWGEEVFAVVRWANNSVQAHRLAFASQGFEERWVTIVEPPADLSFLGIIGGGFDNFHQGDSAFFVYADADREGNLYVGVASTEDVLSSHDAFFGEDLGSGADPEKFDFATAVVTRISPQGERTFAKLLGRPGRGKRFLNLKVAGESVVLVGRIKTGDQPTSWDGWILSAQRATGELQYERSVDVDGGDMFWDVAAMDGGKLLAVGSTSYTQNPGGLSVSDARDGLALLLDSAGNVERRVELPAGPAGRGTEAISASVNDRRQIAIGGVQDAPGTHAEVHSDAFLVVRGVELQ